MTTQKLKAMKSVYTYFFPEVRPLVHSTDALSDKLFLTTTSACEAQGIVDSLDFNQELVMPKTPEGKVDLDEIHFPIIDRIVEVYKDVIPGLKEFPYRYPTSGSSEGLFHTLAKLKSGGVDEISTFEGEYEGYKEYGKALGIKLREFHRNLNTQANPGTWFISNPSAFDGNIIPNEEINALCDKGNKVYLDLAYVGSTKPHAFDVSHKNISAVFISFSKPYGVFRFRMGFTFSREPIDSLYANKWFKDVGRLISALKIAEEVGPKALHEKYNSIQKKIVESINSEFGLNMKTSDALLLSHLTQDDASKLNVSQLELIAPYKRGSSYRFCLTPYYEEEEAKNDKEKLSKK